MLRNLEIYIKFWKNFLSPILLVILVTVLLQVDLPSLSESAAALHEKYVLRQLDLTSGPTEDWVEKGWIYYQLGRLDQSQKMMEEAFASDGDLSAAFCLGLIDLKNSRFESAAKRFEHVSAQATNHVPSLVALGQAYYGMEYFTSARARLEKAVSVEPANVQARLWLGKTYLQLNRLREARDIFETLAGEPEGEAAALLLKSMPRD